MYTGGVEIHLNIVSLRDPVPHHWTMKFVLKKVCDALKSYLLSLKYKLLGWCWDFFIQIIGSVCICDCLCPCPCLPVLFLLCPQGCLSSGGNTCQWGKSSVIRLGPCILNWTFHQSFVMLQAPVCGLKLVYRLNDNPPGVIISAASRKIITVNG